MGLKVGILIASDRASAGTYPDKSGPALTKWAVRQGWSVSLSQVVPDDRAGIAGLLAQWCDAGALDLILTTGGTGVGPRDVTPEATRDILEREVPGLAEHMRREGMTHTPLAALSRAVAGVRGKTIVVNLPGSPTGALESIAAVAALLPHLQAMLQGGGHPA
jgi:molybdenum cofactor synthesis domain-containing protein